MSLLLISQFSFDRRYRQGTNQVTTGINERASLIVESTYYREKRVDVSELYRRGALVPVDRDWERNIPG
jgi:hypothetical protein